MEYGGVGACSSIVGLKVSVSMAILTERENYLDTFWIQFDSFFGISDSVAILFKLDIGL